MQQEAGFAQGALRAKTKFKSPTTFNGRESEDAVAWMDRFEKTARYNRWTDADKLDNFEMYLEGAARKWYACEEADNRIPREWSIPRGEEDSDSESDDEDRAHGLKELFLRQFTPTDYRRFNENRLRDRKQRREESVTDYFFDVLDLCRVVNREMTEREKLDHLFRGLRADLVEKLWSMRPRNTKEFLKNAQEYQEIAARSRSKEWLVAT